MNIIQYYGIGSYHTDNNTPCQDYVDFHITQSKRIILGISDGCSSCTHSDVASKCVVQSVIDYFSKNDDAILSDNEDLKKELLCSINDNLMNQAVRYGYSNTFHFSATLIFAVFDEKSDYVLVGHIGDGNLLCFSENGELMYYSSADNYLDSAHTYFVNSSNSFSHFDFELIPRVNEQAQVLRNIILYTDGPQKMFASQCDGDIPSAVKLLIDKIHNDEIVDCDTLKNHIHNSFSESILNIHDDWSLIVFDTKQLTSNCKTGVPVVMKLEFLIKYLERNPRAVSYTIPDIQQIKEMIPDHDFFKSEEYLTLINGMIGDDKIKVDSVQESTVENDEVFFAEESDSLTTDLVENLENSDIYDVTNNENEESDITDEIELTGEKEQIFQNDDAIEIDGSASNEETAATKPEMSLMEFFSEKEEMSDEVSTDPAGEPESDFSENTDTSQSKTGFLNFLKSKIRNIKEQEE